MQSRINAVPNPAKKNGYRFVDFSFVGISILEAS
jgi:hypothetical protein